MKITIEQEGKEPKIIETGMFFLYTDKGASWKGVETHIVFMLEAYAEMIRDSYKKNTFNGSSS